MSGIEVGLAVVALLVVALLLSRLLRARGKRETTPYIAKGSLVTPAERAFLGVLEQAVGDEYRIHAKVRMADVVGVRTMRDRSRRQQAFNRIPAKHFDFVLCTPGELMVLAAIELDDKSHGRRDRRGRDRLVTQICRAIRLPLIRFAAKRSYTVSEVRREVLRALGTPHAPELGPLDEPSPASDDRAPTLPPLDDAPDAAPTCPECRAPMVASRFDVGGDAGPGDWRCTHYPECPGTRPGT